MFHNGVAEELIVLPNSLEFLAPLKRRCFTTVLYFRFAYIGDHADSWSIQAAATKKPAITATREFVTLKY